MVASAAHGEARRLPAYEPVLAEPALAGRPHGSAAAYVERVSGMATGCPLSAGAAVAAGWRSVMGTVIGGPYSGGGSGQRCFGVMIFVMARITLTAPSTLALELRITTSVVFSAGR